MGHRSNAKKNAILGKSVDYYYKALQLFVVSRANNLRRKLLCHLVQALFNRIEHGQKPRVLEFEMLITV